MTSSNNNVVRAGGADYLVDGENNIAVGYCGDNPRVGSVTIGVSAAAMGARAQMAQAEHAATRRTARLVAGALLLVAASAAAIALALTA